MRIFENIIRTLGAFVLGFLLATAVADGFTDMRGFALFVNFIATLFWCVLDVYREVNDRW